MLDFVGVLKTLSTKLDFLIEIEAEMEKPFICALQFYLLLI